MTEILNRLTAEMVEKNFASESIFFFNLVRHLYVIQMILTLEHTTHNYNPF